MLDRQQESIYYPAFRLQVQTIRSVLCLAPHPDDEVFGCGGLLTMLAAQGSQISTLILSQGEKGAAAVTPGLGSRRVQESIDASTVLGVPYPEFADLPDRGLVYAEPLIARIAQALQTQQPQYLLLPSLSEPHPDHQAIALAGMAAAQRCAQSLTLLFYEVGAPQYPNCYLDISSVAHLKWRAVQTFTSQLGEQTYEDHARAFASLRAYGLDPGCTAAEAFFEVSVTALRHQGPAAAMPYWPLVRTQQQLANSTQQLPLVSVLIRSLDRPQLVQAVASVVAQTYSHVEIIVLNAGGRPHSPVSYPIHRLTLHMVNPAEPSNRSRAANLALQAAHGDIALFLDDDDLLEPTHLERLVGALAEQPLAIAAYAGVRVESQGGTFVRNYDFPWSRHRLNGINFLPIHAVAFRLAPVRQAQLQLDETLPVLEDWDFWRRLARLGDMVHCPGVSALYRQGNGQSELGNPAHAHYWKTWHTRLIDRFVAEQPDETISQTLAWHAIELDRVQLGEQQALSGQQALATQLQDQRIAMVGLQEAHARMQLQNAELHTELQKQQAALHQFSQESQSALDAKQALLESFSRESQAALSAKQAEIESFSRESQVALQAKQQALDALVAHHQSERAALQSHIDDLQQQVALTQSNLAYVRNELHSVHTSLSWRVTAPLRSFNAWRRGSKS